MDTYQLFKSLLFNDSDLFYDTQQIELTGLDMILDILFLRWISGYETLSSLSDRLDFLFNVEIVNVYQEKIILSFDLRIGQGEFGPKILEVLTDNIEAVAPKYS